MAAHNSKAAETEPLYVAEAPAPCSRTRLTSFDTPDEDCPTEALVTVVLRDFVAGFVDVLTA